MQLLCNNYLLFLFFVSAKARLFISNESDQMHRQEHSMRRAQNKEAVFSDVLKNITRVNDVLEDLIHNYERLQKMYNTQETIESSLSSDSEIDEEFKHKNKNFRQNSEKPTTTPRKYQVTEMILSEEFSEDYATKKNETKYEVKREPKLQYLKQKDSRNGEKYQNIPPHSKDIDSEHSEHNQSEQSSEDKYSSHDEESATKSKKHKDKQFIKEPQDKSYSQSQLKKAIKTKIPSKLVVVQTTKKKSKEMVSHKSTSEEITTSDESNETDKNGIQIENPLKTRFNVKQYSSKEDEGTGGMSIEEPISFKNIVQRVVITTEAPKSFMKKIIQSESFTQNNIWEDIINMKPVHLKTEKEITYNTSNRKGLAYHLAKLFKPRATEEKIPLFPIYKNNEDSEKLKLRSKNDSFEDEKIFNKEMFKTKILRKAYGDACLKVVIRKCYKACTKALKLTCKSYACKHRMKPTFKERARKYCLREFDDTPKENTSQKNFPNSIMQSGFLDGAAVVTYERDKMKIPIVPLTADDNKMRAQVQHIDNGFMDITRNGYLAPACLSETKPMLRSGNNNGTVGIVEDKLNILRDRFERECKRSSAEKCIYACNDAVRDACDIADCKGGKKRNFEKNCKKECKASYSYKSDSDSDSSSSGSSGSSSYSSSDSSRSRRSRERKKSMNYNNRTTLASLIKRELHNIRIDKTMKEATKNKTESAKQQNGTINQEPDIQQRSLYYRSGINFKIDSKPSLSSARTTKPLAYKPILRHIFYRRDD